MKIIGITGKMGSGKSTLIECLYDVQQSNEIRILKFAAPLYDMQHMLYNRISSVYKKPEGFIKDRKLLQWLGTDWGRDTISSTLWTDLWKTQVANIEFSERANYKTHLIVSDDVRFDNEAEVIKSLGGIVIEIRSDKVSERIDTSGSSHKSEAGIDYKYIDAIIENNGTIQDLKDSLLTLNSLLGLW